MPEFTLAVRLSADGSQLIGELKQSQVAMDKLERETKEVGQESLRASLSLRGLASNLFNLRNTIAALGIGALAREITQVGTQFESWESKIKLATGSSDAAADSIRFVGEEADRLGISLESSIEGFSSLAVAAKGTAFEGEGVRDIFTAVSEASSVLRLSQEETSGVMRAFTQISSLAVLSMEEMQQLAERGVPANLLYARAFTEMGITTGDSVEQMLKLVSTGKVLSSDALPAITKELREFVAAGVDEAAESTTGSFNRLSNAIFGVKLAIAESGLIDFFADVADFGVKAIKAVADAWDKGITAIKRDRLERLQLAPLREEEQEIIETLDELRDKSASATIQLKKLQEGYQVLKDAGGATAEVMESVANKISDLEDNSAEYTQSIHEQTEALEENRGKQEDAEEQLKKLASVVIKTTESFGGGGAGGGGRGGGGLTGSIGAAEKALKSFENSIVALQIQEDLLFEKQTLLDELFQKGDEGGIGANVYRTAIEELNKSMLDLTATVDPAAEAMEEYETSVLGAQLQQDLMADKVSFLDQALKDGVISLKVYKEEMDKLKDEADPFAESWTRAIDEIDQSFADLWKSAFAGFEEFSESLKNTFRTLLAELAHAAITRPILVQLGVGGQLTGGGGLFGQGGAAAGGLGEIARAGSLISNLFGSGPGFLSSFGGGIGSGLNFGAATLGGASSQQAAMLAAQTGEFGFSGAAGTLQALGGAPLAGLATLAGPLVAGLIGDAIFGEGGGLGAGIGAGLGSLVGGPIVGTLLGGLAGGIIGSIFGSGGKSRPTKLRAGAFPIEGPIEGAAAQVESPFGHILGFGGSRIGDKGQLSNEDYDELVANVAVLFEAVAEVDQLIIDTVGDIKSEEIAGEIDDLFFAARISSYDVLYAFLTTRFNTIFTEIEGSLGSLFVSMSEGLDSVEIVELAGGFSAILLAMEQGKPIFSDVADVTETISILFTEFVREGETVVTALSRMAQASQLLALVGFDDTTVSGTQTAVGALDILGPERLTQLIDTYLVNFFSQEELLQSQLDLRGPALADQLSGLGTTSDTFRTDFEAAIGGGEITGDAIAAWLEAAEALAIVNTLTEELNALLAAQADSTEDQTDATEELVDATESLTDVTMADVQRTKEQLVAVLGQIAGLGSLNDAYRQANETLLRSVGRQRHEVSRLAFAYDGSVESALALANATETLRQAELALLAQIDSAILSINQSFTSSIRDIELALLDTEGQYDFLTAEAEALAQTLGSLTDPDEILSTAQLIQQLTSQAFGLLNEDQRKLVGGEFITFLEEVSNTSTSQLEAQREATISAGEEVMEVVEAALNRAAERFDNAATRMVNAADSMQGAAVTMLSAAQQPVQAQVIIQSDVVGL